jgi:hypothetical protein
VDHIFRWSCCAQIDLLGFANQIALSKLDIRAQLGRLALERLTTLEDAIRLLEKNRSCIRNCTQVGYAVSVSTTPCFLGSTV